MEKRILKNDFLQVEYRTDALRISGITPTGKSNLLVDLRDMPPVTTPHGDFYFGGGHRLWHAPEAMPRTYIPDGKVIVTELPDSVVLDTPTEPGTGIRKRIEIHLASDKPSLTLTHTLINDGMWMVELAPWAITQFRLGGTVILPMPVGNADAGVSHETAEFARTAIRRWWLEVGQARYPGCHHLLLQADSGGANASDSWLWKAALQTLADQLQITIAVNHYPTGASKWNLIEHRMFCVISQNWAGQPLDSYETMLKFIRTSKTQTGFRCQAHFDRRKYQSKQKLSPDEKANLNLHYYRLFPEWNYTIKPHGT